VSLLSDAERMTLSHSPQACCKVVALTIGRECHLYAQMAPKGGNHKAIRQIQASESSQSQSVIKRE